MDIVMVAIIMTTIIVMRLNNCLDFCCCCSCGLMRVLHLFFKFRQLCVNERPANYLFGTKRFMPMYEP